MVRFEVDLPTCRNNGQCVYAAPSLFSLDADGRLALRHETDGEVYRSPALDEDLRDDVEAAADLCPQQAIEVSD